MPALLDDFFQFQCCSDPFPHGTQSRVPSVPTEYNIATSNSTEYHYWHQASLSSSTLSMGQQASPSSYELSRPLKVLIQTTQEENQIIPVTSLTNCQWGQCDASFSNPAELIGHVNLRHLSPCESPTRTSNDGADSDSELTIPRLQIEDSSINVSNLSCHWRNCNKHPPVPEEPDPHTCSLPYEQWRDLIAVHIFRDHLGLPLDIFAPEVSKDDVEKMNVTQNASRNTDPRNSEMDMLTAPSLSPSISSQGSVDVIETPPRDYMDKDPPQSIEMDVDMSLVSNAVNKTTVPNTPHTSSHRCLWLGCNESFKSCEDLTTHLSKVHVGSGRPVYECLWEGCTRNKEAGFGSRQKINRHLQSHTGHRPFQCSICQQHFSEAATLQQHMRRHTREKPYVCDHPGCGKSFAIAGALTIHKRMHSGHKPFKCPHCNRAFAESSNLSKHLRTHTGIRPYSCSEPGCLKAFARPDQLTRHLASHRRKARSSPSDQE